MSFLTYWPNVAGISAALIWWLFFFFLWEIRNYGSYEWNWLKFMITAGVSAAVGFFVAVISIIQ